MKFATNGVTAVAHGANEYRADKDGVLEIPDYAVGPFLDLVNAGILLPLVDAAPAGPDLPDLADVDPLEAAADLEDAQKSVDAAETKLSNAKSEAAKVKAQKALSEAVAARDQAQAIVDALAAASAPPDGE